MLGVSVGSLRAWRRGCEVPVLERTTPRAYGLLLRIVHWWLRALGRLPRLTLGRIAARRARLRRRRSVRRRAGDRGLADHRDVSDRVPRTAWSAAMIDSGEE